MSIRDLRGAAKWALMVALGLGAGAVAIAQQDKPADEGRVVQIGRSDDASLSASQAGNESNDVSERQQLPEYWIGLRGGPIGDDDPLRAHVDLPANQGLLVVEIVPDSPAAKAGLKKYDILLRANDTDLHEMTELVDLVLTEGEKKGQLSLDILRHGERETLYISPEERPASAQLSQQDNGVGGGEFGGAFPENFPPEMRQLFGQLDGGQMPFNFRNFGPGVIVGGQGINVPNGVSVSVQKEGGKPTRVTVKRGDETWEVVGDDPESLQKLPEDLRPFVEQTLKGGSPLGGGFQMDIPNMRGQVGRGFGQMGRGFGDENLQDRLEQMERQINELLQRVDPNHAPADQPNAEEAK